MALTDTAVRKAKVGSKQYRLTDGQGLYLLVTSNGKKHWRLDYILHGKRKTFAIGQYPAITLAEARNKRDEARRLVADGVDPVQQRRQDKISAAAAADNTFAKVSERWFEKMRSNWSDGHIESIRQRLNNHILPYIGFSPVGSLNALTLHSVLTRLENAGKLESAKRVRIIMSQVFRYAIAAGLAERDPAADLKGVLRVSKPKPMAAIVSPEEIGALLRAIDGYQGEYSTKAALRFSVLTFARPGEIRRAEWREINWIAREWRIPADKMKMRRDHVVPLSVQALQVLRGLHKLTGQGKYLFPSLRSASRPMSENTVLAALRRLGYSKDEMTAHGFRAMASSLLHEEGYDPMLIELQLAHRVGNAVAAAYNRAERIEERTGMMQEWSNLLDRLQGKNVVDSKQGEKAG
ncbi:MAG: tyrosine-type recombinase/integrase [Desulfobulbaceae bacterium]|nr:tyrosine-type recombinase/integrase [Desulfobulbaceae bacterium]